MPSTINPKDTIRYNFLDDELQTENTIVNRIAAPAGFKRLKHPEKFLCALFTKIASQRRETKSLFV